METLTIPGLSFQGGKKKKPIPVVILLLVAAVTSHPGETIGLYLSPALRNKAHTSTPQPRQFSAFSGPEEHTSRNSGLLFLAFT